MLFDENPRERGTSSYQGPAYQRPHAPRYDPLDRDAVRDAPTGIAHRPRHATSPLPALTFYVVAAGAGVAFTLLGRALGTVLTAPQTHPAWAAASLVLAFMAMVARQPGRVVAAALFVGPVLAVLLSAVSGALQDQRIAFSLFAGVALLSVLFTDAVSSHYVAWILANARIPEPRRARWREAWAARFSGAQLRALADERTEASERRSENKEHGVARSMGKEAAEFSYLRGYPLGFLGLLAALAVVRSGPPNPLLYLVPVGLAAFFAFRASVPGARPRHVFISTSRALVSWLFYGRSLSGVPGVFQSPGGQSLDRMALAALVVVALSTVTTPANLSRLPRDGWGVLEFALSVLLGPLFVLFVGFFSAAGRPLTAFYSLLERPQGPGLRRRSRWDTYVERLMTSEIPEDRRRLFLGFHATEDYPIQIPLDVLTEHVHVLGSSGSGKTARAMAPLMSQLIRRTDAPVVILDLKGDMALFENARREALAQDPPRTFKWFTTSVGKSTYAFNPFQTFSSESVSLNQACALVLDALQLEHGAGYGRSYFSRMARLWLTRTLQRHPNVGSFAELRALTGHEHFSSDKERQDAGELLSVIELMASYGPLNLVPGAAAQSDVVENAIHMPDVVRNGEVVYFYLPAARESASVREIANLALYCLLLSTIQHLEETGKVRETYLFVDEFQRISASNFRVILEQARSFGMAAILANQSLSQLSSPEVDLRETVLSNTRLKLYFSANDDETRDYVISNSGETVYETRSRTVKVGTFGREQKDTESITTTETVGPRLTVNDVIRWSNDPDTAIFQLSRGADLAQFGGFPFPLRTMFHIEAAEYAERQGAPWPSPSPGTMVVTRTGGAHFFGDVPSTPADSAPDSPSEDVVQDASQTSWRARLQEVQRSVATNQGRGSE
jgi:hypothetical protein